MITQTKRPTLVWLGSMLVIVALSAAVVGVVHQVNAHPQRSALAATTASTGGSCSQWYVATGQNPSSNLNDLSSVAAIAANDVWAVGEFYNVSQIVGESLTEHWNGSAWTVVPSPNPGAFWNWLEGAAAIGSNDVWTVGWSQNQSGGIESTVTEHWNGSAWSVIPSPNGPNTTSSSTLVAVSAVSAADVWAVGMNGIDPLVEHWDGSAWSLVTVPAPGNVINQVTSVVALSASDVWVAGSYRSSGGSGTTYALFDHFDGSSWSQIAASNPGWDDSEIQGLAAVSSTNIWAVGYGGLSGNFTSQSLTEHWDGTSWTVVPSPNVNGSETILQQAAAVSANDVFAVGYYVVPAPIYQTAVILRWNGVSWQVVNTPNLGTYSALYGISAISSRNIWAVGALTTTGTPNQSEVVIEHYNPLLTLLCRGA